jgi:GntR family transcriptional regulator/MocR family aminotransferase
MRTLYAGRRSILLEAARELPLELDSPQAGIHCVGWLPDGKDERVLAHKAADYDLSLTPISNFSIEPLARRGFLLGYGGYTPQEIKDGIQRLGALLRST